MRIRTAHVEALPARPAQQHGAGEVHDQGGRRDEHHATALDGVGIVEPADALDDDPGRGDQEEDAVGQRREHLGPLQSVAVPGRAGPGEESQRAQRDRKRGHIARTGAEVVATGNVGCMTQLAAGAQVPVVHTVELLDWATGGPAPRALANFAARAPSNAAVSNGGS